MKINFRKQRNQHYNLSKCHFVPFDILNLVILYSNVFNKTKFSKIVHEIFFILVN